MLWIILGVLAVLAIAQLLVLGTMGGVGPLGFIRRNRIAKAPGNGAAYNFDVIAPIKDNPFWGGNLCVLGSSVAFGACSDGNGVGEYLSYRLGVKLTKEAVSGTTLVTTKPNSYVERLKRIPKEKKFDLFLCQLSTNDATLKCPLGEISDGNFDNATVTGALEYIISYAQETWGCPVVFFVGAKYDSDSYEAMVKRLLELKKKWSIIVLDLWSDDAFNAISEEKRKIYMIDKIHPTKAGYRDWWGPELERQLLNQK